MSFPVELSATIGRLKESIVIPPYISEKLIFRFGTSFNVFQ